MSETNWDPFPTNVRRTSSKTLSHSSSSKASSVRNQNMDELFAKIKEVSDIYRQKRRHSNQTVDWSLEDVDVSVSSEDSDDNSFLESLEEPVISSVSPFLSSIDNEVNTFADNEESEQQISTNFCENPTNSSSDNETKPLRRSQRQRIPVMQNWRGQRAVYKRDSSGLTEKIVTIEEGIDYMTTKPTKRPNKRKNRSQSKSNKDIFNLSIHTKPKKKFKTNKENKNSLNIKSLNDLIWNQCNRSSGVDIAVVNKDKHKSEAVGMLRMQGKAEKKSSLTGDYRTQLTVFLGVLGLTVEDNEGVVVRTGDSFEVQSNTNYSLVNLRKDMAYVSFTVFSK